MWPQRALHWGVFPHQTHNFNPIMRKPDKPKLKDILQNTWPVFYKTLNAVKNKESLRYYHRPQEPTQTWHLNGMCSPGLDPGTENIISGKASEIWVKYGLQLKGWCLSCDTGAMVMEEVNISLCISLGETEWGPRELSLVSLQLFCKPEVLPT